MFVFQLDPTQFPFFPGIQQREAGLGPAPLYLLPPLGTCCKPRACMPGEGARADRTPRPEGDCGLAKNQIMMRCLSDF